jgi:hypothetical protein
MKTNGPFAELPVAAPHVALEVSRRVHCSVPSALVCLLSSEEPIRAHFGHFTQDRLLVAAVLNPGIESLERWSLNQGVIAVGRLNGNDVDKGKAIAELERRVSQSRRTAPVKLLKHFFDVLLVFICLVGFDFISND